LFSIVVDKWNTSNFYSFMSIKHAEVISFFKACLFLPLASGQILQFWADAKQRKNKKWPYFARLSVIILINALKLSYFKVDVLLNYKHKNINNWLWWCCELTLLALCREVHQDSRYRMQHHNLVFSRPEINKNRLHNYRITKLSALHKKLLK
jgi:hypothetical protein